MTTPSSIRSCRLRIQGMTCTACSTAIESTLQNINGVQSAAVALATEVAEIKFDTSSVTLTQLVQSIDDMGFEASIIFTGENDTVLHLKLENSFDEELLRFSVANLQGIEAMTLDALHKTFSISYSADLIGPRKIISVLKSFGLNASLVDEKEGKSKNTTIKSYYQSFIWSLAFTIPVFLMSMVFTCIPSFKAAFLERKIVNMLTYGDLFMGVMSTPVQFIIGWRFYIGAYKALKLRCANMDCLVVIGTNAAYFYSVYVVIRSSMSKNFDNDTFFETSAMLISFILLGKYLLALAKGKTSDSISKLMKLAPETARLVEYDGGRVINEELIDRRLVERDDVVKVLAGERVSVDGVVVMGESHVDESMITGESRWIHKIIGDVVIGGTMNVSGVLHVRVTCVGSDTLVARIIQLVEGAQMGKAPVQKLADRISQYFVPLVTGGGVLTLLVWYIAGILEWYPRQWIPPDMDRFELALQFGITVVVVACPCALGLATPTAVMVGTGIGASLGILLKGGQALEGSHKVNRVVFDKTGTLTAGKPTVVSTRLLTDMPLPAFFQLVAAAEVNSEHPLGEAIVEHAKNNHVQTKGWPEANDFESIIGHGVKATVCEKSIVIGNNGLMDRFNIQIPKNALGYLDDAQLLGQTAVLVSVDGDVVGVIAISDAVKPEASEVISVLRRMGIKGLMVTGDSLVTASAVAKEVGIDSVVAEAKPEDKVQKIRELQKDGFTVAMVGDGINDSPALAIADVGMAIGAGSDIAIEVADIVLMSSNLEGVITAIDLSRKTFKRIQLNYVWALAYNVMAIPIAAGALFPFTGFRLPPWVAGAAMGASSVSVVCSSILLKHYRKPLDLDWVQLHGIKVQQ